MDIRHCFQRNISKDSKETEEVLIFQKCCCTHFMNLYGKDIIFFTNIRCKIKLRGCKTILSVPDKLSIDPQIHRFLYSFEANTDSFSNHRWF